VATGRLRRLLGAPRRNARGKCGFHWCFIEM
jgi:hypothetical protein